LYQRFGGPIAIALELSHGPIVYALQKYDFLVLFPINPSTLAKYREAFTPSRAKDDPTDAELALDLLLCHPDRFQPLAPQSVELRALAALVEQRRGLVNDRVRITNHLRNTLKQYSSTGVVRSHQYTPVLRLHHPLANPGTGQAGTQEYAGTVLSSAQHVSPTGPGEALPVNQGCNSVNPGCCGNNTASITRDGPD
jgi:hypothetical protein